MDIEYLNMCSTTVLNTITVTSLRIFHWPDTWLSRLFPQYWMSYEKTNLFISDNLWVWSREGEVRYWILSWYWLLSWPSDPFIILPYRLPFVLAPTWLTINLIKLCPEIVFAQVILTAARSCFKSTILFIVVLFFVLSCCVISDFLFTFSLCFIYVALQGFYRF